METLTGTCYPEADAMKFASWDGIHTDVIVDLMYPLGIYSIDASVEHGSMPVLRIQYGYDGNGAIYMMPGDVMVQFDKNGHVAVYKPTEFKNLFHWALGPLRPVKPQPRSWIVQQ